VPLGLVIGGVTAVIRVTGFVRMRSAVGCASGASAGRGPRVGGQAL